MSKLLIDSTTLTNIADAIRNKIDSVDLYSPAEMAARIWEIQNSNNFKLGQKIITANGVYNSSDDIENPLDGYSRVIVSVLNQYAARDENKVVKNGELVSQTSLSINKNGTYDTTTNNSVEVQVPSETVQLGSKIIKENGIYHASDDNYEGYYSIEVNVPKSDISLGTKTFLMRGEYSAEDDNLDGYSTVIIDTANSYLDEENHMVVVGQRLMSQTSTQISENGTYDTTLNNETIVNVQPPLQNKTITENGTFAADAGYYGLGTVVVDLPNAYYISDIDKVVLSNGLSVQTSRTITSNGSYNTTTNNQVTVSVPSDLDFIEGNISSNFNRTDVTKIRSCAFMYVSVLQTVNLPNCSYIGNSAFYCCSYITSVILPSCTSIGTYVFYYCSQLTNVTLPNCINVEPSAFYHCDQLTNITLSNCTNIGRSAFYSCFQLSEIDLPQCLQLSSTVFAYCSNLQTINLPNCNKISGNRTFAYCSRLTSVFLPKCTEITYGLWLFEDCYSLRTVSLPKCTEINATYMFEGCSNIRSLYLMNSVVCTLANPECFYNDNFTSSITTIVGYASIYVPQSLVSEYKIAENWSYLSSRFVGI